MICKVKLIRFEILHVIIKDLQTTLIKNSWYTLRRQTEFNLLLMIKRRFNWTWEFLNWDEGRIKANLHQEYKQDKFTFKMTQEEYTCLMEHRGCCLVILKVVHQQLTMFKNLRILQEHYKTPRFLMTARI